MTSIAVQRQRLAEQVKCQFLEPDEFVERATSRSSLVRANELDADVHGLFDPLTGERYYVETERLADWRDLPRSRFPIVGRGINGHVIHQTVNLLLTAADLRPYLQSVNTVLSVAGMRPG